MKFQFEVILHNCMETQLPTGTVIEKPAEFLHRSGENGSDTESLQNSFKARQLVKYAVIQRQTAATHAPFHAAHTTKPRGRWKSGDTTQNKSRSEYRLTQTGKQLCCVSYMLGQP